MARALTVGRLATAQTQAATEACAQTRTLQSIDDNSGKMTRKVPVSAVTAALAIVQWILQHWLSK